MTHRIGRTSARGVAVLGLATLVLAGLSAVPARADDRGPPHERRWHRDHRPIEYDRRPDVYYAPPPVIYAPPGASLNLTFPLFR